MLKKLVVVNTPVVEDDRGFTHRETFPFYYKSKEKFLKDFMKLAKKSYKEGHSYGRGSYFEILGKKFEAGTFYYIFSCGDISERPPLILELDEWFRIYNAK